MIDQLLYDSGFELASRLRCLRGRCHPQPVPEHWDWVCGCRTCYLVVANSALLFSFVEALNAGKVRWSWGYKYGIPPRLYYSLFHVIISGSYQVDENIARKVKKV
jgi:hypothetical protein